MLKLCRVIEELVGIDCNAIKLFMKVLLIIKYHIFTIHGISQTSYGGIGDKIVGTGQGNITSSNAYRNKSCLIIENIDRDKKGAIMQYLQSQKIIQRTAVAFIDDASMFLNGEKVKENIQFIINKYQRLCKATGGNIQSEKSLVCC